MSGLFWGVVDVVEQYAEVCGMVSVHVDVLSEYIGCVSHRHD